VIGKAPISGEVIVAIYAIAAIGWGGVCVVVTFFAKGMFLPYALTSGLALL
jgi:hypothetical protein